MKQPPTMEKIMKRSEINRLIRETEAFLDAQNWKLPEWGYWSWEEWQRKNP